MTSKITKFRGISSGDWESLCFDVTREDFTRLMGKPPTRYDKSIAYHLLYRFYPDYLLPEVEDSSTCLSDFEVTVEVKPTTEYPRKFKRMGG